MLIHVMVGIIVGLWVGRLPQKIHLWTSLYKEYLFASEANDTIKLEMPSLPKRKKKLKNGVMFIWIMLLLLYIQSSLNIGPELLSPNVSIRIFIRSLLIILTFYFVIRPCVGWLLNRWLQKRKIQDNDRVQKILQFLPDTKELVIKSWQLAAKETRGSRVMLCGKIILLNILVTSND
jgi:hypothetical protein